MGGAARKTASRAANRQLHAAGDPAPSSADG